MTGERLRAGGMRWHAFAVLSVSMLHRAKATSSSWLNLVERWFREITDKRIRRGAFRSVNELVAAIDEHRQAHSLQRSPPKASRYHLRACRRLGQVTS